MESELKSAHQSLLKNQNGPSREEKSREIQKKPEQSIVILTS